MNINIYNLLSKSLVDNCYFIKIINSYKKYSYCSALIEKIQYVLYSTKIFLLNYRVKKHLK